MNEKAKIGVVGIGLMGSSIATCILAAGHQVTSFTRHIERAPEAKARMLALLMQLKEEGILKGDPDDIILQLTVTDNYTLFKNHEVVIESVVENIDEKKEVFRQLEQILSPSAIIGSNTSAIPVS